ncbi:MAG TPA: hypothetical protein VLI39_14210 [Sedimentisphaerales bacterium]|nr:hypothetical protein [Sedimentisphaerales bacterium]
MTEAEAKYRAFLRKTAQTVEEMLSGVVKIAGGQVARVDPQRVQDLFHGSVRNFVAWFRHHHRTENRIAETYLDGAEPIEKPNPIDWATPAGRKAFAGDRQLACCAATLCAIHDANKNACVDVRSWPLVRTVFYRIIRDGMRPPVYDRSVIREALGRVAQRLVREAPEATGTGRKKTNAQDLKTLEVAAAGVGVSRSWLQTRIRCGELRSYRRENRGPHLVSMAEVKTLAAPSNFFSFFLVFLTRGLIRRGPRSTLME